jgi:tetratricopeptide (TPR) repeat protein
MSDKKLIKKHWANYFKALQKQEWDKSLVALNALKGLEHDNPQVHLRTGDLLQRTNELNAAINSYHEAAQCLLNKGFDHKAIAVYKIILKIDPNERDALDRLREILMEGEPPKPTAWQEEGPPAEQKEEPPAAEQEVGLLATTHEEGLPAEITPSLFRSLSNEEVEAITSNARRLSFDPGEIVIKEGDVGDSIFLIIRGRAQVSATIGGKTIHLALLESGDTFGEVAYLTGRPRTATVSAEGELEVMEIGNPTLKDAINKNSLILNTLEEFYSSRVKDTINKLKTERAEGD